MAWSQQEASPRWLCVLPFTNETDQPEVGRQVRRSFAGHLSVKRFRDVELHEIDTNLPADWRQLPAQSLGKILGCHALAYGLVSRARRLYLGVYADIALDGGILLIETHTGRTLEPSANSLNQPYLCRTLGRACRRSAAEGGKKWPERMRKICGTV